MPFLGLHRKESTSWKNCPCFSYLSQGLSNHPCFASLFHYSPVNYFLHGTLLPGVGIKEKRERGGRDHQGHITPTDSRSPTLTPWVCPKRRVPKKICPKRYCILRPKTLLRIYLFILSHESDTTRQGKKRQRKRPHGRSLLPAGLQTPFYCERGWRLAYFAGWGTMIIGRYIDFI